MTALKRIALENQTVTTRAFVTLPTTHHAVQTVTKAGWVQLAMTSVSMERLMRRTRCVFVLRHVGTALAVIFSAPTMELVMLKEVVIAFISLVTVAPTVKSQVIQ